MTLYEIDTSIRVMLEGMYAEAAEAEGEVSIDPDMLAELMVQREQKLESIACYIKNLKAEAAALKAEEENLKARRQAADKKREYLEKLLTESMTANSEFKFSTPKCAVSFRKSEKVEVPDADLLDDDFCKIVTTRTPDKNAIKQAFKEGQEVRGAFIRADLNIQIK